MNCSNCIDWAAAAGLVKPFLIAAQIEDVDQSNKAKCEKDHIWRRFFYPIARNRKAVPAWASRQLVATTDESRGGLLFKRGSYQLLPACF